MKTEIAIYRDFNGTVASLKILSRDPIKHRPGPRQNILLIYKLNEQNYKILTFLTFHYKMSRI